MSTPLQKKCSNCHWWNGRNRKPPRQSDYCNITMSDAEGPINLTTQAWVEGQLIFKEAGGVLVTKQDSYCIQWKEVEDE